MGRQGRRDRVRVALRRGRVAALALVAIAAPPASADAPWSAPSRVPGSVGSLYDLWFGGRGVLSALCCNGFGPGVPGTRLSTADAREQFGRWRTASRQLATRAVAGAGSRRYAFGWIPGPQGSTDTGLARLTPAGLGRPFRVLPPMAVSSEIARAQNGAFAIVGQVSVKAKTRGTRRAVYLAVKRRGHSFERTLKLAGGGDRAWLAVAVTPDGDALAAWARNGAVVVRERAADGRLGPARKISDDPNAEALTAALTPDGTAAVAWISHPQGSRKVTSLQIALRPAGGRFGIVRTIEQMQGTTEPVDLLPGDADQVTVGWIAGGAARVAYTTGGPLTKAQTLAGGDVSGLHLADRVQGGLVATWQEPSFLRAAVRAPGADSFGPTETIAGPALVGYHLLAYDPATLLDVVAWTQGKEPNPPVYTSTR